MTNNHRTLPRFAKLSELSCMSAYKIFLAVELLL